jgi:hypothetical protein
MSARPMRVGLLLLFLALLLGLTMWEGVPAHFHKGEQFGGDPARSVVAINAICTQPEHQAAWGGGHT